MKWIVVTGAAGFIGCNLCRKFNEQGNTDLILIDNFDNPLKNRNLEGIRFSQKIDRNQFIDWLTLNSSGVEFIFHLGARTDTTEFDFKVLDELNLSYSKALWEVCTRNQIPLLYASSAATYGLGENGFSDEHSLIQELKPLNPYGLSKQLFDLFVLEQKETPPFWCGLKFFNVYGPYENHKGRMASVVYHGYHQIKKTGKVKLFQSHRDDYKDGEQLRDFIYVEDVIDVCLFFLQQYKQKGLSGIYNVGTGKARTFNDLVKALFTSLNLPVDIEYIPIPQDIRDKYQYFTQAEMEKLQTAGYRQKFTFLEKGVEKYTSFLKNV